jgi:hypothetical protein
MRGRGQERHVVVAGAYRETSIRTPTFCVEFVLPLPALAMAMAVKARNWDRRKRPLHEHERAGSDSGAFCPRKKQLQLAAIRVS